MEVKVLKFDHFGRGLSKINDKVVFTIHALPNEIVDISIIKEKSHFMEGKIDKIIKPSSLRINPICPYFDKCGGCDFLHTTYDTEKEFKINKAKEVLGKVDNFYETPDLFYRNKCTLHVKNNKIGYYEKSSNNIITIDKCYLVNEKINNVISDLQKFDFQNLNVTKIIIKTNQDKILLWLDNDVNDLFMKEFSYIDIIICNNKVIKGNGYLEEEIDNKIFKITKEAFFQVNKVGLLNINKIIQDYLKNKSINHALDLYSGTGLWGILISNSVNNVTCIELNKEACLNAKDNLIKNRVTNVKIINGDVADYIDKFNNIDLVITDPPRSGLDKKTIEYLKRIKSKYFIYVSCDMQTLKRDLDLLNDVYKINEVNLVDMFRGTYHVECVCLLSRKTVDK